MKILFEVRTPLNVTIRITEEYWRYIVEIKHKIMANKERLVKEILAELDEVRRSLIDKSVFLYYKKFDRLYCVVAKHLNDEGFITTAYPTDKIKEGEIVWTK
jgi:hypothetical protein